MMKNLIKIKLVFIVCLGFQSCNESPDSLAEKACNCYQKARELKNSDGKLRQYENCGFLVTSALESLQEQSIKEDWTRDEYDRKRDDLNKKLDNCE